ncbi:PKSN polyketide synthase for alternapyrone biosynthesis protein [Colletotrichum higginsianum]|uniref:PKSN polyketide synthase for alternapyrone biosynthesis protein n=1 Tax=Colletotrichum higginsianum (strain IMI 349063) TaxID=759273 RepID=H1VVP1_COLHI|nr:PKSN polyketide synthase for alternapyrone biosynthesis protein [Colletotrichum higginsianum]
MDPMQRLGLEIAYEAFENAGIPMQKLAKSTTAVYSGAMTNDYQMLAEADPYRLGVNSAAGTGKSMLSNRISWFFDLQGPSLTVDTACSSSLYAVHLACQSIRTGESDQALVTGHNLIVNPTLFSQLSAMHMVSPDGISHSFDAAANGYGRGEGIAGLVLKRLSSALADGDVIRAVVRATGVNSDGKTPGITVPSEDAQAELIRRVYEGADLDMARTAYFEAHGTGTPKGDPIEVRAIRATIAAARKLYHAGPLYVGSVKPNIGHTEGCAGLAGLIKTVLCLEAGVIPPVAGLREINPELLEHDSNLIFPTVAVPWPAAGLRRASINSFGFGGANAHVVLDDARHHLEGSQNNGRHITRTSDESICTQRNTEAALNYDQTETQQLLFVLSSFDRKGLGRNAKSLETFLAEHKTAGLSALAHILAAKRTAHAFRGFVVATTREELVSKLLSADGHLTPLPVLRSSQNRRLVFLLTGQGAQRPGMAKELLTTCSVFRDSIASSQKHLQSLGCEWDLADLLVQACAETLNDAKYSQPACTAVQIALIDLLRHWGVVPSAVIGHSSGELAAAFAAGAISHKDAIRVAYYRGFLSTKISSLVGRPGAMLAVGLSELDASRFLEENGLDTEITIACVNSPSSVTMSGPSTAISLAEEALRKAQNFVRLLRTGGVAYHSPDMNVVGDEFFRCLGPLQSSRDRCLQVPMYSSVTELRVEDARTLTPAYWHLNMTSPVRFAGALHNLLSSRDLDTQGCPPDTQHCTVLEIGPAKTLAGPVTQIMANIDGPQKSESVPYLSMLSANEDSRLSTLTAAGMLWSLGVPIDLNKVNDLGSFVHKRQLPELPILPPYAWNHDKSYWHDAMPALVGLRGDKTPRIDLLGTPVLPRNPFEPAWHNVLRINELPWLVDHVVDGAALFPAAGYLAMAIEAVRSLARDQNQLFYGFELMDVTFENSLMVSKDTEDENHKGQAVSLTLKPDTHDDWVFEFAVYAVSTVPEQWQRLAKGTVVGLIADKTNGGVPADFEQQERERQWHNEKRPLLHNIKMAANKHVETKAFYAHLASIGLEYGPTFQGLNAIRCTTDMEPQGHGKAFGECIVPDSRSTMPESYEHDYLIHPATLDSLFQLVFAALQSDSHGEMTLASIPISVRRVFIASTVPRSSGARLVGMAASKRLADKNSDSRHADTSSSDLTFCDASFERPAVLVEEIVLRQILSPTASSLTDSEDMEDSSFHRTGKMVWKEDIDQPLGRWQARILQEPSLTGRTAFILDRFCHKRAHAKVLCLGFANPWDTLLGQTGACIVPSFPSMKLEDCTSFDSLQEWDNELRRDSRLPSPTPGSHKYDLVFLDSASFNKEKCPGQTWTTQQDWMLSAVTKTCVADAWLVIVCDDSSHAAAAEQVWSSFSRQSSVTTILLSESSVAMLPGINTDPVAPLTRYATDTAVNHRVHRLLPELCQDGIVVIGPGHDNRPLQSGIRNSLLDKLASLGIKSSYIPLDTLTSNDLQQRPVISLVEFGSPFVYNWSKNDLEKFRMLICSASLLLWLTTADFRSPSSETTLRYAPTVGLLRTIRAEFPDLKLPLLDISAATSQDRPEQVIKTILEVLQSNLAYTARENTAEAGSLHNLIMPESEYSEVDGRLFIPRVLAHAESDRYIAAETSLRRQTHLFPAMVGKMQEIPERRYLSDMSSVRDIASIRLQYAATHTSDMAEASDTSPFMAVMAQQTVGVVEGLAGDRNTDIFGSVVSPGDVVFSITRRPVQPMFSEDIGSLIRLPDALVKLSPAVAYWLGPLSTAFYILSKTAGLSPGDSLLVDVGDDTVLQRALLQVAKCLGVGRVFVVAGERCSEPVPSFDSPTVTLPRLSLTSARLIRSATGGVNIVVSKLSSFGVVRRFSMVLADDARVIGVNSLSQAEALKGLLSTIKGIQFIDPHDIPAFDVKINPSFEMALSTVLRWIEQGRISLAEPLQQLRAANAALVARTFTSNTSPPKHGETARVLLSIEASDVAVFHRQHPVSTPHLTGFDWRETTVLDPKGTYIISGGLGALGLPLAEMLCELGARKLVLLSRSGHPTQPDTISVLEGLEARGCCVEVAQCDIASKDDVEMLAQRLKERQDFCLRGVIQSAMVLADSTFSNMTMDQWQAATKPKIQGSWNLHNLTGGQGLDFFILMSSVSGVIGNSAQANYCAGNTFEDALAHYRRANGFPATSLNIGLVSDSSHFGRGTMSSYGNVDEYLAMFGHLAPVTVTTEEMFASVKMVLTMSRSRSNSGQSTSCDIPTQLIVGISDRIPRHEDLLNRWPMDRKFDHRTASDVADSPGQGAGKQSIGKFGIQEMMASAKDIGDARRYVEELLRKKVAQATGIEVDSVDAERSLVTFGIDSLKATEIRNWVTKTLKSELSVFDILSPAPISALSLTISTRSKMFDKFRDSKDD